MKIERDFSFVHPIAPGAKNGVSNGELTGLPSISDIIVEPNTLNEKLAGGNSGPTICCSAAWQPALRVLQLTQTPITRKPFQLPSGSLFRTNSTWPRSCLALPPTDATY